jgi:hypothetical protein
MEGKRVSAQQVKQAILGEVDQLAEAIAQAMNAAQDGHIIADTEEPVHDATAVFREQVYEKAIRLLQDRQEAFSPSARRTAEQRAATNDPSDCQRASGGA